MSNIQILKIRKLRVISPLKALVDIQIGLWTINDWRIIQQKGQRIWVQVPQTQWKDETGKLNYKPLLSIPNDLKNRIEGAILLAWKKQIG